jgi:hypothetical protein
MVRITCLLSLIFLLEKNASAQFIKKWTYEYTTMRHTRSAMDVDSSGNVFSVINYTPSIGDKIGGHTFQFKYHHKVSSLVKTNTEGTLVWHRTTDSYGPHYNNYTHANIYYIDVAVSPNGKDIVVIGFSEGKTLIPRNEKDTLREGCDASQNVTCKDFFIMCYSDEGDLKWKKSFGEIYSHHLDKIEFNQKGELFLIKGFDADLKYEGKQIAKSKKENPKDTHLGVFKFNVKGKFLELLKIWNQAKNPPYNMEDISFIEKLNIEFDSENNLMLYGSYYGNIQLSDIVTLSCHNKYNDSKAGFLAKYDNKNQLLWQFKIGGNYGGGWIESLDYNEKNEMYFTGSFGTDISISDGKGISFQSSKSAINHSGVGTFYGKIDNKGILQFVKYHKQEKHYTNCAAITLKIDDRGFTHQIGYYNDSMQLQSDSKLLFAGVHIDTLRFEYDGKPLEAISPKYLYGTFHAVWLEDSLISVADFIKYESYINYSPSINEPCWKGDTLTFLSRCVAKPTLKNNGKDEKLINSESHDVSFMARIVLSSEVPELALKPDDSISTEVVKFENTSTKINVEKEKNTINPIEVIAYPNPFQNQISVNVVHASSKIEFTIYNDLGQLIHSQLQNVTSNEELYIFNTENLSNGIYFLSVKSNHQEVVKKILKVE